MIAASLVVIGVTVAVFIKYDRENRFEQIRIQGVSLTRLLSKLSFDRLTSGAQGPLELIRSTQSNAAFAYGVVVSPENRRIADTVVPGVIPPMVAIDQAPSAWHGERILSSGSSNFLEFHSPVIQDGELVAHIRVGYLEPEFGLSYQQLPFFAWIALPIFLLAPAFYYLIRREIQPLNEVGNRIQSLIQDGSLNKVELTASDEISQFVGHLNTMIGAAEHRVRHLESERTGVLTSSRVLSYQKARIESVLESIPQAIIVMDEQGTATYTNQKLVPMVGIDHEAIIGKKPHEWCEDLELRGFLASYNGTTARKNASELLEITPPHNPRNQIAVTAYPLFSPRDRSEVYGTLVVFSDITLESLAKQARKELVAQLSHELKTPLHVIGMYAEMLLDPDEDGAELRVEAGNVIIDEVERVTALINNMLNILRIEMGSVQLDRNRTRLGDLLKDALQTVTRSGEDEALEIKLELPAELIAINVDKEMLRVAINNLLTNAIKYNQPGGEVVLGAEETEERVRIYVRDRGCGIKPEDQALIYEEILPHRFRGGAGGARAWSGSVAGQGHRRDAHGRAQARKHTR